MKKLKRKESLTRAFKADKYPELDVIAREIVTRVCMEIEQRAPLVLSAMIYKQQYTLEEVIRLLQERV